MVKLSLYTDGLFKALIKRTYVLLYGLKRKFLATYLKTCYYSMQQNNFRQSCYFSSSWLDCLVTGRQSQRKFAYWYLDGLEFESQSQQSQAQRLKTVIKAKQNIYASRTDWWGGWSEKGTEQKMAELKMIDFDLRASQIHSKRTYSSAGS